VPARRTPKAHRSPHETSTSALRPAMLYNIGRKISSTGEISLPGIPGLIEQYMAKLAKLFDAVGKPFTDAEIQALREIVERSIADSWRASPFGSVSIEYETRPPPHPGVQYTVKTHAIAMDPPLFGTLADAKVMDVAASLGPAAEVPVLEVGAGAGRNTLTLARLGHPTVAVEPAAALASVMRKAAEEQNVAVDIVESSVLDPALALDAGRYKLAVLAAVITSQLADIEQFRRAVTRLTDALAPGGTLLLEAFLAMDGFKPDVTARQVSQTVWSCIFTRSDFAFISKQLPLDLLTDESVVEYEKSHLPPDGWPPTGWFVEWAQGLDVFALPEGKAPVDLRWLAYRKR
jgi:hypothetical protein